MKTITLRDLPPELEDRVEAKARELGLSLNKTVTRLLQEHLCPDSRPLGSRRYHDLEHLAGSWTVEEADQFDQSLEEQRRIDPALWD
jgi:hypothetical protein